MTTLDQALSDLRAAHEEIAGLKKEVATWKSEYNSERDGHLAMVAARNTALARVELLEKQLDGVTVAPVSASRTGEELATLQNEKK